MLFKFAWTHTPEARDETVKKLTTTNYETDYQFNAGQYDAAIAYFVKRGFVRTAAESTAYVILAQAKIDSVNPQEILDKLAHGGIYQQPDNQKFTPFGATFKIFANSPQERDAIVEYSQRFGQRGDYHQVSYGGIEPRGGMQKYVVVIMVNNDAHFQEFNQYLQSMRIDFEELTLLPGQLETPEQKQQREQARNAPQQQQGMMPGMGM